MSATKLNPPVRPALSKREDRVLRLAAEGLVDKEIAVRMDVSIASVRTYWERMRKKLNAANRSHAIALAMPHNELERAGAELGAFIVRQIDDEAIFVCDENHTFLTWNQGVFELFGYDEQEWVGSKAEMIRIPEDREEASVEFEDASRGGASVNDRWHLRKDGSQFWGADTVLPLDSPSGRGAFVKIVRPSMSPEQQAGFSELQREMAQWTARGSTDAEIAQDLNLTRAELEGEWKKLRRSLEGVTRARAVDLVIAQLLVEARQALSLETDKLALIISAPEDKAVLTFDMLGLITGVSRDSETLLGKEAADMIGKPIDLLLARARGSVTQTANEMKEADSGALVESVRRHIRDDGTEFDALHHLVAIVGPTGHVNSFVRELHDLSRCRTHEIKIADLNLTIALLIEG